MLCAGGGDVCVVQGVRTLVANHASLASQLAAAGLHGALAHMMRHRKAMPVQPTPDYSIETLTL